MIKNTTIAAFTAITLNSTPAYADNNGPSLFGMEKACQNISPEDHGGVLSPEIVSHADVENNQVIIYRCATDTYYGRSCPALAFITAARSGMSQALIRDGRPVMQVNDYFNRMEDALTIYCVSSHRPSQEPA